MRESGAPSEIRPLTARDFDLFRQLAYEKFGLDLRPGKEQLVSARLAKNLRRLHFRSYKEYYRHIEEDQSGEALAAFIDALTTNHTGFFREAGHFELLRRTILPPLRARASAAIWSAACSSGEEPYTIAFSVLEEWGPAAFGSLRILATDISSRVLASAERGIYPGSRFDAMGQLQARRYLLHGQGKWAEYLQVKPEVRALVEFRRLNLMDDFSHLGTFPAIFCRNVMIYFDNPTQERLVNRLAERLEPGGYLLIGHAESLNGIRHGLRYVAPAVYRKPRNGEGPARRGQP